MAFDQTSIPTNLRPLNTVRNLPEDPRISAVTSSGRPVEGFYVHPSPDGSPNSMPAVYYPATVADSSGFVPLGYNNAVTGVSGWVQHIVPPPPPPPQSNVVSGAVMNPTSGFTNTSPSFGTRFGGSASDQASEESGDGSFSGQKVKFMCSFGGKILPRVSDGALRYVGGHTRIISVRKDVSFVEFVQKMSDMYGQNVVIKYQLPEEDLDALVSVSCPDDLENMMDEYEKLIERSSDGSAKMRIFLFSPSELENAGLAYIGDLQDVGHKYVEAVNGITDGLSGGGRIARNNSIESANSALNSDMSGTEGAESLAPSLGEVSGGLSPRGNYTVSFDTAPRMVCVDPNTVNTVPYADPSASPLSIPLVKSGPPTAFGVVSEQDIAIPQVVPSVGFPASSPYIPTYVDRHQETLNHANYVQLPSPMGFPGQILGPVGPVLTQQHIPVAAPPPQQFTPNHMTMNPPFISMNHHNPVRAVMQPQHVRVEHYPGESVVAKQRVVQIPVEQGYSNAHQAQVPATVQGAVYNWQQIRHPEQVVYPEGGVSSPPVVFADRSSPRLEDCHMCQKQLPHAHSDTVAQEQKDIPAGAVSDLRSIYCSLPVDGRLRPVIRPLAAGTPTEGCSEQLAGGVSKNDEGQYGNEKTIPLKAVNPELTPPPQVVITSGAQVPYGVFLVNSPPSPQDNVVVQPQIQVMQDTTFNRPLNHDFVPVGVTSPAKDYVIRDSPVNVAGGIGTPVDDSKLAFDNNLRQIDGSLQNIQISPSELLSSNKQSKFVAEHRKEEALENRQHQIASSEVTESPMCNPSSVYSGVEPTHAAQRSPPFGEWKDNVVWSQPKINIEGVAQDGSSISPSYNIGDIPDDSGSLFVNQDPWNMRPDSHFPPPRPGKIQLRKESPGSCRDSPLETQLSDGAHQIQDFSSDRSLSNKGSAEEQIRQELQAVAEGVAASVLCSSGPSTPPVSQQSADLQSVNVDIQQRDEFDEISTKLSERINFGYPASGIGRLQIIKNSDLEELRELGSGTFGTVYHGKWRGTDVAIKRINDRCFAGKPSEQDRMRDDFWNEAIKLADLHHPNVVAFYGIVLDGPDGSIATVTEYMVNGSLRNALQKNERNLDKRKRLLICMDVAFGMEYLHGKNIVHFDLKSDNLLVNLRDPHRPICKVGDLGLSKVKCNTLISGGVRGTLPWMAPELLNGSSSLVSEKVDVFSFGIVMWELLTGDEPYADLHYGAIIGGIVSNTLRPAVPEACDPDWTALMERCWASEPRERPNFTEIASELRAMAAKLPPKGQAQSPSANAQVKS